MPQNLNDYADIPKAGPARPEDVIEDLGDGLLLRRAREEDIPANARFQAVVQADPPDFEILDHIGHWTTQLMDGSHPTCRAQDFLLVHDTNTDQVVSSLGLLRHTLTYDGLPVPTGMPELVGTHPAHRHRRLVARQFAEIHRWSEERGDRLQIIDGIPWYYRQYGYEMGAQRFGGRRYGRGALPKEASDGLRVRRARGEDAAFLASCFAHGMQRYRLACPRDEAFWRFELEGRHDFSTQTRQLRVIETEAGEGVGFFNHVPILFDGWSWTTILEMAPGAGWSDGVAAALHFLRGLGPKLASAEEGEEHQGAALMVGTEHPAYDVLEGQGGAVQRPYAWYTRVADLPGFLEHVAPALEARLVGSAYEGFDGELALNFYRMGVRLPFAEGRLGKVTTWKPSTEELGDLRLPDLTFLHLLFGHRTLEQLMEAFVDCQPTSQQGLVETLFPPRPSFIAATS